jgi:hypothetical protein
MMNCGEGVTVAYPLFQEEGGGSIPTSPLQFEIMEIDIHRAQKLNSLWHSRLPIYATGSCLHATICFGALYDNYFYGAAIWSNPVARLLPQREWLELRRLAISPNAPKNTASRMLRIMIMIIRNSAKGSFFDKGKTAGHQEGRAQKGERYLNRSNGWRASCKCEAGEGMLVEVTDA